MKTRAEQNPPARIAVFNPVERSRKVRSGWLLLCYWDIIAQSSCNVKYAADFFKTRALLIITDATP